MICQRRVTAGEDLKLSHSCPSKLYHAYKYVFPAERDNLSVPLGQAGWVHLTPDHPCGIWGMAVSVRCVHPQQRCVIYELCLFVGICRGNLPIL